MLSTIGKLSAVNVGNVFRDSMFREDEIVDGKPTTDPVLVEGITLKIGFHPTRLESHREELVEMMNQLPIKFFPPHDGDGGGGGASFLEGCMTRDGEQWGEHSNMQEFFCMLIGLKLAAYCAPREFWEILPGGMPYIVVGVESKGIEPSASTMPL